MAEYLLPSLGADMDEGTVVEWRVQPGDTFGRGDVIALVETEKGIIEAEIWENGTVGELLVEPGTSVAVGTPIMRYTPVAAEEPAVPKASPARAEAAPAPIEEHPPVTPRPAPRPPVRHLASTLGVDVGSLHGSGPGGLVTRDDVRRAADRTRPRHDRVMASPRARAVAAELGVDLRTVAGTGARGEVTEADVRLAAGLRGQAKAKEPPAAPPAARQAAATAPAPHASKIEAQRSAMRKAIADVMTKAKREIPHYYLGTAIDFATARSWLDDANAARPVTERILPAVLLLKATALAAKENPEMNGHFVEGAFRRSDRIHLGVAISLRGGGLIAPAIHDADTLAIDDLMAALRDLVQRTRTGRLRSSEMSDPTLTVTNLGERGVDRVFPVIYAPQVAIVGFGRITERPWATGGMIGVRPVVEATLAADHRVSDGHTGARFLTTIETLLQHPEDL